MKQKVLVSGSLAYDRIMNFPGHFKDQILPDKIHILNVSFLVKTFRESFGGTAGNIAYNLSLLEEKPVVLSRVGDKDFSAYQKWLDKNKIDSSKIKIDKNKYTAGAYIITDQADNQITGFFPGAMSKPLQAASYKFTPQNLNKVRIRAGLQAKLAIVSPQHPLDMKKLPLIFKKKKIPYIFDPGQQITSLTKQDLVSALTGSKVLIGNDYEISLIMKKTGLSITAILNRTEILVTTLGKKGSTIRQGNKLYRIPPARPKNTSDPTGAGDAYRAGLIKGLIEGWPLEKAGRLASLISVYTVEKYGTQTHSFTWPSLAERYRQNFSHEL